MTKSAIAAIVARIVRKRFAHDATGHDWYHIERVWKLAKKIASAEKGANRFVVELGALLHDIADWKFHGGDLTAGHREARKILVSLKVRKPVIDQICHIVEHVSFKGAGVGDSMFTREGRIVQDADRLDAIGAIGIARAFAYGGKLGRAIYDPTIKPVLHQSYEHYKRHQGTTLNHFYEKSLLLKDRMHTKTAKRIAIKRHAYLERFLEEFFTEWKGNA